MGAFKGGAQPKNFLVGFVQIARVVLDACGEVQTLTLVVWSLVVTLEIQRKAKLKHTVKGVRLINITFKKIIGYLTGNRTVSIRLICDYFLFGRSTLHCSAPGAKSPSYATGVRDCNNSNRPRIGLCNMCRRCRAEAC